MIYSAIKFVFRDFKMILSDTSLCWAGLITYAPGGTFGPRIQEDYQIVVIRNGSLSLNWNDEIVTLGPDENLLLPPGHREYFQFSKSQPTEHSWLSVRTGGPEGITGPVKAPHRVELDRLIDLFLILQEGRFPGDPVLRHLASAALTLFLENENYNMTGEPLWVGNVMRTIAERYGDKELSLDDLSSSAGFSKGHFIREFKKIRNISPARYLWQYRREKALSLLKNTGLKVNEIAEQTGFESPYHFSRAIKEQTGFSPLNFRKQSWNSINL